LTNSALAIKRDMGLPMPLAGPGDEHDAPGHVAEVEHRRNQTKAKEPPVLQPVLSPPLPGFYSACTACFGLAASLHLF